MKNVQMDLYQTPEGYVFGLDSKGVIYIPSNSGLNGLGLFIPDYPSPTINYTMQSTGQTLNSSQGGGSGWLSSLFSAIGNAFVSNGKPTNLTNSLITKIGSNTTVPVVTQGGGYNTGTLTQPVYVAGASIPTWLIAGGVLLALGTGAVYLINKNN